jgi:hypothetical protein
MQAPIDDVSVNRRRFEWIDAMQQIVLCAEIPHDILRPRFTAWLEGQTKAFSIHLKKKS